MTGRTNSCMFGAEFPTLTNPGVASDLASGKQLIDQNGEIVTGTASIKTPMFFSLDEGAYTWSKNQYSATQRYYGNLTITLPDAVPIDDIMGFCVYYIALTSTFPGFMFGFPLSTGMQNGETKKRYCAKVLADPGARQISYLSVATSGEATSFSLTIDSPSTDTEGTLIPDTVTGTIGMVSYLK